MTQRQLLLLTASFLSRLLICLISTLSHMPPSQQHDSGHTYVIWSVVSLGLYSTVLGVNMGVLEGYMGVLGCWASLGGTGGCYGGTLEVPNGYLVVWGHLH